MGLCDEGRSYVRPPADMLCIPSSLVRQFYRIWGICLPLICCGIYSSIWVVCDSKLSILQNITGHKTNKRRHCKKDRRDLHLKVSINTLRREHSCKKSSKQRKSIALLMFRFIHNFNILYNMQMMNMHRYNFSVRYRLIYRNDLSISCCGVL